MLFRSNILLCLLRHQNIEISIIDPKAGASFAEFTQIKNLEILGTDKAGDITESFVLEMESRYVRKSKGESFESMPYRVLIVDELSDLIKQNKDIETHLIRLAQKAREARIHLVLATQRPDSATLSGSLRSNVPSRIALKVQKSTESKIILDEIEIGRAHV